MKILLLLLSLLLVTNAWAETMYLTCKAFYTSRDEQKKVSTLLYKASGFFRTRLSKVLDLRHTPTLSFIYDTAPNTGAKIEDLLSKL